MFSHLSRSRYAAAAAAALVAAWVLGAAPAGAAPSGSVTLVAYSTPKPAYSALITAFQKTSAGKSVTFSQSYGPSGTQATSVANGLPTDVVNFSLEPDIQKLVKAGLVSSSWNKNATQGMVTNSVVAFVVRKGNPKHITGWSDLTKQGVQVVTPNPFSSGSAQWNLLAAYGAQLQQGKSESQADTYLDSLLKNTVAQPSSASTALQTFLGGQGDVLLDYEDDALYAQRSGEPISVIIPPQTILIQNPIAVLKNSQNPTAAKAFVSYLLSPAGQKIWGQQGYRPVLASVAKQFNFPKPKSLFTINYLGGWTTARAKFFDPTTGIVAKDEQSLGVSTASS
jgi:sulfate/thiosulfate transport system substrate-binding protein